MGAGEQILDVLARIEEKLDRLLGAKPASSGGPAIATEYEMSGDKGDPKVRTTPRDWKGQDFKGCNLSATTPEFCDLYAEMLEYFAGKNPDAKKAEWDRKDARRARGWSKRLREGWKPPTTVTREQAGDAW
jgi:hypothetical protein